MVTGVTPQINNSIVEKYCYNNEPANCNTYGGLYNWGETVQYQDGASNTTSPSPAFSTNIQGIAPAGFHIPSDAEYKTLEMSLGMSQAQADSTGWRGTTEGDKLKSAGLCQGRTPCGGSGFNSLLEGTYDAGSWYNIGTGGGIWSSSESNSSDAWRRSPHITLAQVYRSSYAKVTSFPVRALKN